MHVCATATSRHRAALATSYESCRVYFVTCYPIPTVLFRGIADCVYSDRCLPTCANEQACLGSACMHAAHSMQMLTRGGETDSAKAAAKRGCALDNH
eukprot:6206516-Pleurochrysis_carterae.AAC.1